MSGYVRRRRTRRRESARRRCCRSGALTGGRSGRARGPAWVGWLREQAAGSAAAAAGGGRLYRFRESLFLLPAIVVLAGVALAEVCAAVDPAAGPGSVVPLTLDINSNAATWLLSTVAGATITTAGVVSSLTVVNLQPASSQSSPRECACSSATG